MGLSAISTMWMKRLSNLVQAEVNIEAMLHGITAKT